jgi:hypothetical protein
VTPDPIRVDPILDAAPGSGEPVGWPGPSVCSECDSAYLVVVPPWGLGDALCLPCLVRCEVAAEVDAGLEYRLSGRRYSARAARPRRGVR